MQCGRQSLRFRKPLNHNLLETCNVYVTMFCMCPIFIPQILLHIPIRLVLFGFLQLISDSNSLSSKAEAQVSKRSSHLSIFFYVIIS